MLRMFIALLLVLLAAAGIGMAYGGSSAESSTAGDPTPENGAYYTFDSALTSLDVQNGVPISPTTSFSTTDSKVYAWARLVNVYAATRVRRYWYDPSGSQYSSATGSWVPVSAGTPQAEVVHFGSMAIAGFPPAQLPGLWRVDIYVQEGNTGNPWNKEASLPFNIDAPSVATATATATSTPTPTGTPTATPTASFTPSNTGTPTTTHAPTATVTPTPSRTSAPTKTNTPSPTGTATRTPPSGQAADIYGHVALQGRRDPPPRPSYNITITLTLRQPGTETVAHEASLATDASAYFTATGAPPGVYDLRVKGSHTLGHSLNGIVLALGSNVVDLANNGALKEGDADDNNYVTIVDFSLLRASFGKCAGTAGYDDRTNFDQDTCVTILDFSLLRQNFGQGGD